jgi:hypothetical protein
MKSRFTVEPTKVAPIDQSAYGSAWIAGTLEVHSFVHTCPACWEPWTAEIQGMPGQFVAKPDPVRLGMYLLCGTCEAKRRLHVSKERGSSIFFGEADVANVWGRLRNQPRAWIVGTNLGSWDGRALRDDKDKLCRSFVRAVQVRGGICVPDDLRETWGWVIPRNHHQQDETQQGRGRNGY